MTSMQKTYSPIDGSLLVERPYADAETIALARQKAKQAQQTWQLTSLEERQKICQRAVEAFSNQRDEIAKELSWQMGRPIRYAAGEVDGFVDRANTMIELADEALAKITLPEKTGFTRYIERVPLGVVFVVAPWNYPYLTAINSIMPAILAGNAVLLKHSAQTPLCAERIAAAFDAAGLPAGVFQYLHMGHADTERLIQSQEVNYVAFTGSVAGGEMVERAAAGRFIGAGLELGGKDPAYVRADADLSQAVETIVDGAFFNSGQSCCGIERVYVHESIYEEFVQRAVALVKQYKLGRPDDPETTLGPLVKTAAADFVRGQIAEALEQGAVAHIDASDFAMDQGSSPYLAPQLLTGVNHTMRVMTEESFGPVLGVQKVASDDEAIQWMNDSEFGLTASIFTRDMELGVTLGNRVECGTFFLNRCDYLDPALAWAGVKNSGRGCSLSRLGYESLTRPKSYHLKTLL